MYYGKTRIIEVHGITGYFPCQETVTRCYGDVRADENVQTLGQAKETEWKTNGNEWLLRPEGKQEFQANLLG
ncbi:hypothetical protein scyTo_0004663 [Scyliorhinus torazame]|uniref:Uncharacterized protein n=1 Tax=Scyliorhinus torazame TaxID=75743 RepID=A0A401NV65_SCYTO|nr:hypothetical protein [Scyliorhinus torazame]